RFLAGEAGSRDQLEAEYVRFAVRKAAYGQIRFLDLEGREMIRVNYRDGDAFAVADDQLQSKATRYYFRQAGSLGEGDVFVSPFDLNVEHGQIERPIDPVIRFLTPVFDGSHAKRGYLVVNYQGAPLLAQLRRIAVRFSGDSKLVNSAGEYLLGDDPGRAWGWLLGHANSFRGEFPTAWDRCVTGRGGEFRLSGDQFAYRRLWPGRHMPDDASRAELAEKNNPSSLILVAHVPALVADAQAAKLLRQLVPMTGAAMAAIAALLYFWARAGVIRKMQEQRILESESRLRQLSSMLLAAQETERRNLSRDLHDELGQLVTAIRLDLRSLEQRGVARENRQLLGRAISLTDQLLQGLHAVARRVRPRVLDDLGLRDAVESLLSEYEARTGISICSRLQLERRSVPPTIGENVYRILQEALANIASHAQVEQAEVTIESDETAVRMVVQDHGVGFDPQANRRTNRLGVLGMRERAELLQGELELRSTPGEGVRLVVTIPLEQSCPPVAAIDP
ncbi:MAG: ATP-binding protein, partial [Planctomycetota bacterium]